MALGRRGSHHWNEFAYVYAAANYPLQALQHGEFEVSNIHGFFDAKIGHVAILSALMKVVGSDQAGLAMIAWIYTAIIVLGCWLCGVAHWLVWRNLERAAMVAVSALLFPVSIYLAPRFLSEVPSFTSSVLATVCLATALGRPASLGRHLWLASAGAALAVAMLTRGTAVLLVAGFCVALFLVPPRRWTRSSILVSGLETAAACILTGLMIGLAMGLDPERVFESGSFAMRQHVAWVEYVRRVIFAVGPVAAVAGVGLWTGQRRELLHALVWLVGAVAPVVYEMHFMEERFLVYGVPAMAALVALGADAIWSRVPSGRPRFAVATAFAVMLALGNYVIQPRTLAPFDSKAYVAAVDWIHRHAPNRPVLVGDAVSEFDLLRLVRPDRDSVLIMTSLMPHVMTPVNFAQSPAAWQAALADWYGDAYVDSFDAMERRGSPPWYFVATGATADVSQRLTWLAGEPRVRLHPVHTVDSYVVYRVDRTTDS